MAEPISRPLPTTIWLPTLGWVLGIWLSALLNFPLIWAIPLSVCLMAAAVVFRFHPVLLLLLFVAAGVMRFSLTREKLPSALQQVVEQRGYIVQQTEGKVIRRLYSNDSYLVRFTGVNGYALSDKAILRTDSLLVPGDGFSTVARIEHLPKDPFLSRNTLAAVSWNRSAPLQLIPVWKVESFRAKNKLNLERWRHFMLQAVDAKFGHAAPFTRALLFGDRSQDREQMEQLIRGGTLHLIAISGLHIVFYYFVLLTILKAFLPKRAAEVIFIALMLVYASLCSWNATVIRAILMILLLMLSRWLVRPLSPLQIICLSLFLITVVAPGQLFSIGLQFSFICVLILLYVVPHLRQSAQNRAPWKRRLQAFGKVIYDLLTVSLLVGLLMIPLTLYYYQRGSLNGIVGNLLGVPLIALILPLALALLAIPSSWIIFVWLKETYQLLTHWFTFWTNWTAGLPFYISSVSMPLIWLVIVYLTAAAVILRLKTGTQKLRIVYVSLFLAAGLALWAQIPRRQPLTLAVLNAGMGDCSLIMLPEGQNVMIDTGPAYTSAAKSGSWFQARMMPWLIGKKINRIDVLILSHLHDDHSGGVEEVLSKFRVGRVLLPPYYRRYIRKGRQLRHLWLDRKEVCILTDTLSFNLGEAHFTILHPDKSFRSEDENENSLVVRMKYRDFSALFTGDIGSDTEQMLLEKRSRLLDCDFLKVPHHGSRNSSSMEFIRAVSPKQAVITASRRNRHNFPHPETVKRYNLYGISPCLTGDGSVVIERKD